MKLYYENRLDQVQERNFNDILNDFKKSSFNNYPISIGLRLYITSKDGLNSSFDVNEFETLLKNKL